MILYLLIFVPKIIQNNFAKGLTEKKEKFFFKIILKILNKTGT
jgi:hypothetical protein